MTTEQWQEVTRLFSQCLDVPAHIRERILHEQDVSDEICAEVQRLLRHAEEAGEEFLEPLHRLDAQLLNPGDVLTGRFQIVRFLGSGGMGEVYEALDQDLGEAVALKIIRPAGPSSPEMSVRFRRELQLARRVTHPNVCRLFDFGRQSFPWGDAEFFTMELIKGDTLAALLKGHGPFLPKEAAPYLRQILAGLQAVHEAGIVHRDLKPANVMVMRQASGAPRVVLMDFGLARLDAKSGGHASLTLSREVLGTLGYMAPEQLAGAQVSARTDLYAFGLIGSEMLRGGRPFDLDGTQAAFNNEGLVEVPVAWRDVMERCLNADPSRRPASAQEIAAKLQLAVPGWTAWSSRRKWLAAGGAAAAAAIGYSLLPARRPHFQSGATLLVADLATPGGGPVAVQIRSVLRQSARISVWNNSQVADLWTRMGRSGDPSPSTRDWREIAMRDSVRFVLFPSVTQVGDGASLALRLEYLDGDPSVASAHWQASFEAPDQEHLFAAIDQGGRWIRGLIGESDTEISNSSAKPQAVTTPSWEALKEFSRGESLVGKRDREGAVLAFTSAARIDPLFTMAWMRIGDIQAALGRDNDAFSAWQRAAQVAPERPLTRREDLRFRGMFASDCADYRSAEKLYKEYSFYFPLEWYGSFYRALPLLLLGRAEEAIAELERCVAFPQVSRQAWLHLAVSHMYNQNRNAAEISVMKLTELRSEARAAFVEAVIAHASGETETSLRALDRAAVDPSLLPPSKAALSRAIILADAGRTSEAVEVLREDAKSDDRTGERDRWADKQISLAVLLDQEGERERAADAIQPLVRVDLGPDQRGWAGLLSARFGDRMEAEKQLTLIPGHLNYPRFQIPRLHIEAELRFSTGRFADGIQVARQAAALEPAGFGSAYLAESLERCGLKAEALVEYRNCLRAKSFQLHLATPAPAGSWHRAAAAVRRLETDVQPR
jgi:tetratricopeptide (TPR) repeat protein